MTERAPKLGHLKSQADPPEVEMGQVIHVDEDRKRALVARLQAGRKAARERRLKEAEAAKAVPASDAPDEARPGEVVDFTKARAEASAEKVVVDEPVEMEMPAAELAPEDDAGNGISRERLTEITQPTERVRPAESNVVDLRMPSDPAREPTPAEAMPLSHRSGPKSKSLINRFIDGWFSWVRSKGQDRSES